MSGAEIVGKLPLLCVGCGKLLPRRVGRQGRQAQRCAECHGEHTRTYQREYRRAYRAGERAAMRRLTTISLGADEAQA